MIAATYGLARSGNDQLNRRHVTGEIICDPEFFDTFALRLGGLNDRRVFIPDPWQYSFNASDKSPAAVMEGLVVGGWVHVLVSGACFPVGRFAGKGERSGGENKTPGNGKQSQRSDLEFVNPIL